MQLFNLVRETTVSVGAGGPLELGGAQVGFAPFSEVIVPIAGAVSEDASDQMVTYTLEWAAGKEVWSGRLFSPGAKYFLTRDILISGNAAAADGAVLPAGTKTVTLVCPAHMLPVVATAECVAPVAAGAGALALGASAAALADGATALGCGASASDLSSVAIGALASSHGAGTAVVSHGSTHDAGVLFVYETVFNCRKIDGKWPSLPLAREFAGSTYMGAVDLVFTGELSESGQRWTAGARAEFAVVDTDVEVTLAPVEQFSSGPMPTLAIDIFDDGQTATPELLASWPAEIGDAVTTLARIQISGAFARSTQSD